MFQPCTDCTLLVLFSVRAAGLSGPAADGPCVVTAVPREREPGLRARAHPDARFI